MCNSCASLAGLALCFIACFILLVIAPLSPGRARSEPQPLMFISTTYHFYSSVSLRVHVTFVLFYALICIHDAYVVVRRCTTTYDVVRYGVVRHCASDVVRRRTQCELKLKSYTVRKSRILSPIGSLQLNNCDRLRNEICDGRTMYVLYACMRARLT